VPGLIFTVADHHVVAGFQAVRAPLALVHHVFSLFKHEHVGAGESLTAIDAMGCHAASIIIKRP